MTEATQRVGDLRVLVPRGHFNVVYRHDPGALWRGAILTPVLVDFDEGQTLLRESDVFLFESVSWGVCILRSLAFTPYLEHEDLTGGLYSRARKSLVVTGGPHSRARKSSVGNSQWCQQGVGLQAIRKTIATCCQTKIILSHTW